VSGRSRRLYGQLLRISIAGHTKDGTAHEDEQPAEEDKDWTGGSGQPVCELFDTLEASDDQTRASSEEGHAEVYECAMLWMVRMIVRVGRWTCRQSVYLPRDGQLALTHSTITLLPFTLSTPCML
jgi:hypothetical protein